MSAIPPLICVCTLPYMQHYGRSVNSPSSNVKPETLTSGPAKKGPCMGFRYSEANSLAAAQKELPGMTIRVEGGYQPTETAPANPTPPRSAPATSPALAVPNLAKEARTPFPSPQETRPTMPIPPPAASTTNLPEEVFEAVELPKRKGVREALRAICSTPGMTLPEVARRIGQDARPTGALLKVLARKGLVEVRIQWRNEKEERLHYIAGNLAGMLRVKGQRFLKAADALDGK